MARSLSRRATPVIVVSLVLAALLLPADGASGLPVDPPPPRTPPLQGELRVRPPAGETTARLKSDKLEGHLRLLADAARAAQNGHDLDGPDLTRAAPPEVRHMIAAGTVRIDGAGRVQTYLSIANLSNRLRAEVEALGVLIERVDADAGLVQARVPARRLDAVAALPGVRAVRLPDYGVANTGSALTQGDAVIQADEARAIYGIDGSGVSVGVISDGLNGVVASQGLEDLPDNIDTTACNITGTPVNATGAEGTAMLEIVHDVAPGAGLSFGQFSTLQGLGTSLDFNAAVTCLAEHVDIVVDDIGFFGAGPYDGSSIVSANTADALNGAGPVRAYVTAAANMARQHYQDDFVDSGFDISDGSFTWSSHLFEETPGAFGTEHAGQNPDPSSRNQILLQPGGGVTFVLVWDDPWGSSANDYDTFYQVGPDAFFCGFDRQDGIGGNDNPVEICSVTNPTDAQLAIDFFVGNYRDFAAPVNLDLFVLCNGCLALPNGNRLDFTTGSSSVPNQADAGGAPASVISMGAVRHLVPNLVEGFSSRGPTEDGRIKPDAVAPDGVDVTGAGGFGSPFFGTSAAAPHAAALAALLLECRPELSREELYDLVVTTAVDIGNVGPDTSSGHGRIDALDAANTANCFGYTPTPSPTPGTPTVTPTATVTATPTLITCFPGDVNRSGAVNSIDAALLLQHVAGLLGAVPCPAEADVNEDGSLNSVDAALILQFVAGLIPILPV